MDGVEAAVPPVVRIELEADETVGVAGFVGEAVEEPGVTLAAVEVEIGGEFFDALSRMYSGPLRSWRKSRFAPPGSSRKAFTRASMPSVCPLPSSVPVIGSSTKSPISSVVGEALAAANTAGNTTAKQARRSGEVRVIWRSCPGAASPSRSAKRRVSAGPPRLPAAGSRARRDPARTPRTCRRTRRDCGSAPRSTAADRRRARGRRVVRANGMYDPISPASRSGAPIDASR